MKNGPAKPSRSLEEVKSTTTQLGTTIESTLPEGWCFVVVMFAPYPGKTMGWGTNATREEAIRALQEGINQITTKPELFPQPEKETATDGGESAGG